MKRLFVLFAAFVVHTAATAQITITDADFPMVDMAGVTAGDTSWSIGVGTPGTSQTWDFSAYIPTRFDTSYLTATTFIGNPLFPSATFSSCAMAAGFSMCSYGYKTTTGMYLVGAEQNISIAGTTIHNMVFMSPHNQIIAFPANYADTRNYSYTQEQIAEYTPASTYDSVRTLYHRTIDQAYDGWGTLITPYGTYSALRMKQIQSNIDTVYNHTPGGSWAMGSTSALRYDTSYTWYAPGIGTVATITSRSPYRYSFYRPTTTTGIPHQAGSGLSVYPNPATQTLNITGITPGSELWLYDVTGRIVGHVTTRLNNCVIDVAAYAPGAYILQATAGDGTVVRYPVSKL